MTAVRIGAQLPSSGWSPSADALSSAARALEEAGFDSLWVSDHVVLPERIASWYPFHPEGKVEWPTAVPWTDALVALALAVAATERVALGTDVLLLGLRNPVVFAKQAATLDVASGGRLQLGVGAGWLAEEHDALNVPFAGRGARLDAWIATAERLWAGEEPGIVFAPRPARPIPWLAGGHGRASLRRAARVGGWLAQQDAAALDPDALAREVAEVRRLRPPGRGATPLRVVLRIVASAGRASDVAAALPALARAGAREVIVDLDWERDDPPAVLAALRT